MRKRKLYLRGMAISLAMIMMLSGCGLNTQNASSKTGNDVVVEQQDAEDEKSDARSVSAEESEEAKDLKNKYGDSTTYSGDVIAVKRQDNLQLKIGYNPWLKDQKMEEMFEVYADEAMTQKIEILYDWDEDTGMITMIPNGSVLHLNDSSDVKLDDLSGSFLADYDGTNWGNLGQYYLSQRVDLETGDALDNPVVTVIQIDSEIKNAPHVSFLQTDNGRARLAWDAVEDATDYVVCYLEKDQEGYRRLLKPIARTQETEWVCNPYVSDLDTAFEEENTLSMNSVFKQYYFEEGTSFSPELEELFKEAYGEDETSTGNDDYNDYWEDYICVIAVNKTGASPVSNSMKVEDYSHLLPCEISTQNNGEALTRVYESILDLPATMNITMCDGSISTKVINYDFKDVKWENEFLYVKAQAEKTEFVTSFRIVGVDKAKMEVECATITERQNKLKNKGGNIDTPVKFDEETEQNKDTNSQQKTDAITEEQTTEQETTEADEAKATEQEVTEVAEAKTTEQETTESTEIKTTEQETTESAKADTTEAVTEATEEANTETTEVVTTQEVTEEPTTEKKEESTVTNQTPTESGDQITANSALSEYLAKHMVNLETEIDVSGFPESVDKNKITDALLEAKYQNPYMLGFAGASMDTMNHVLHIEYDYDKTTTKNMQKEVEDKVNSVVAQIITPGMSDAEKEEAINSYLCENAVYDQEALKSAEANDFKYVDPKYANSFTAYGILVDGVGVCASYAASFKLLADACGLECVVVTGYLDGGVSHAWNKVKVDGEWNIIDATNNDNEVIPNALNSLSDSASRAVLVEDKNYVIDSCVGNYGAPSDAREYYRRNNNYFAKDEVVRKIVDQLGSSDQVILRTDYDIDDAQFQDILNGVAQGAKKNVTGAYWLGVMHIKEQ